MRKNPALIILSGLAVINILAWIVVYDLSKPAFLEVVFFDVGQGDAIFIETPERHQVLIDGGPDSVILEKLARSMPFWDRTIDLIILTHPEADHLTGLLDVLARYKVKNILWTGVVRDTAEYQEWVKAIEKEGANIFIASSGAKIIIAGMAIKILYPLEILEGKEMKDSNPSSIVSHLAFGKNTFLFTGDIPKSAEKELVSRENTGLDSDVLKVAHHGSKNSSSDDFIRAVLPEIAVNSAGLNNSYGHPHKEVLDVLSKYGIKIFRTDFDGDIKIIGDGNNLFYGVSNF